MRHSKFRYLGSDLHEVYILCDNEERQTMEDYAPQFMDRVISMKQLRGKMLTFVQALNVRMNQKELRLFKDILPSAESLKYLCLPIEHAEPFFQVVSTLHSLETLNLDGTDKCTIDPALRFESVKRLVCAGGSVKFSPLSFPNLCHLEIANKPSGQLRRLLPHFPSLVTLMMFPIQSELFELAPSSLEYLRIYNGTISDLSGIKRFECLTDLWVQNLPKLTSLAPLVKLSTLRDLSIGHCNHIKDVEILARIPSLERLSIFACDFDKTKLKELLGGRLKELSF